MRRLNRHHTTSTTRLKPKPRLRWKNASSLIPLCLSVILFGSPKSLATPAAAQTFTLDGRLYNSTGLTSPLLDANVLINVKILDPSGACVLYEENQVTSTHSSDGYFNIKVGSATTSMKRNGSDPGHAMAHVFQNSPILITSTNSGCTGYIPMSGDGRKVRLTISPSSGGTEVLTPDIEMDSVPMAIVAESVQGLDRSRMLEMGAGSLTQTNVESVFSTANYPKLSALLGGTSTDYVRVSGTTGASMPSYTVDPTGVAAGQVWLDSTTNQLKFHNGLSVQTISTGTMGAGGIASLGGLTAASQGFAIGVAGTLPAFSSSGSTHTLNIPLASGAGVTGGLISKTEFDAFNTKLSPSLNDGQLYVGNASNVATAVTPSGDVTISNAGVFTLTTTGIASGTYTKIEVDSKGRVVSGGSLISTDIPGLAASHITAGTFDTARLPSTVIYDGGNASGSTVVIGTNDNQNLGFKTNNSTRMTVATNGGVGINTSAPAALLHINGMGNETQGVMFGSGNVAIGERIANQFAIYFSGTARHQFDSGTITSSTSHGYRIANSGTVTFAPASSDSDSGLGWVSADNIALFTNNANRLHVDASGSIGIGTTSPTRTLDVRGTARVFASTEGAATSVPSGVNHTIPDISRNVRRITLDNNTTISLPLVTSLDTDQTYTLTVRITQDATGGRTLTWDGNGNTIKWDLNVTPTPASAANTTTIYQFTIIGGEAIWYASQVWKEQ